MRVLSCALLMAAGSGAVASAAAESTPGEPGAVETSGAGIDGRHGVQPGWLGVTFRGGEVRLIAAAAAVVVELSARTGDEVEKGSRLARLESPELAADLERARAGVAVANADLSRAEVVLREAVRSELTHDAGPGLFTDRDIEAARGRRERAQADLEVARARLREARATAEELERTEAALELTAPADAVVAECWLDPGDRVAAGTEVIRLQGQGPIRVRFATPPSVLLAPGDRVSVAGPHGSWTAEVRRATPEVDPRIGVRLVEARAVGGVRAARAGEVVRVSRIREVGPLRASLPGSSPSRHGPRP